MKGSLRKTIPSTDGRAVGKLLWNEYEKLVEDVKGHALTLNLLGTYLRDAHAGDIRQRDLIKLEIADAASEHRDHACHVMDAYVRWMAPTGSSELVNACRAASERAAQTLRWVSDYGKDILSASLDHLTLGRAALYAAILEQCAIRNAQCEIDAAVSGLRRAGTQHHIPRGLLTRAWLRSLTGARTGPESAQSDLDEAWEIAERGSMRLFLADIHLYRARLFGLRIADAGLRNEEAEGHVGNQAAEPYPWESPQADLEAAEKLIHGCGYHRRDEELADAKRAILCE